MYFLSFSDLRATQLGLTLVFVNQVLTSLLVYGSKSVRIYGYVQPIGNLRMSTGYLQIIEFIISPSRCPCSESRVPVTEYMVFTQVLSFEIYTSKLPRKAIRLLRFNSEKLEFRDFFVLVLDSTLSQTELIRFSIFIVSSRNVSFEE